MITLEVYVGEDTRKPLQIPSLDGTPATTFEATDTLACSIWEGQSSAPVVSLSTVTWLQQVTSLTIGNGGNGYSSSPTVTISGGGATSDATAYAIVTAGVITSMVITDGGVGYDGSSVTVLITDGTGSGATATAVQTLGWQSGLVDWGIITAESALLTPGGTYRFIVTATRSTLTSVVIDGLVKALATPGILPPTPPDLITYDYAESYCDILGLNDAQRDMLPYIIAAASMAARRFCQDRNFDQRTYTEFCDVIQGSIRLLQPPVQIVQRVQGQPQLALTIQNTLNSVQAAQVYFAYTGTWQGYSTNAETPTGIVLTSVSSGVATSSTVTFTPSMTITALATAINLVGGGWVATTDSTLGLWPVTELDGGYVGQGCGTGVLGGQGAQFNILQDLALSGFRLDVNRMGFVLVGNQGYSLAQQWGPGGGDFFSYNFGYYDGWGRVKVTYVGGQAVIPQQVQLAVAEMVKWQLLLAKTDLILESETAQEYSYKLCQKMLGALPDNVRQMLSPFVILRA